MATLNDVISCYNELVDEVNGHTASIDALTAKLADEVNGRDALTAKLADVPTLQTFSTAMASLTAKLEGRLAQVEARLDELVQEHDVMMDTISSLLAAPAQTVVEEASTVELKRVEKKAAPTVPAETPVEEEAPTQTVEEEAPTPALKRVGKKATVVEEEEAPAPKPTVPAPKPTVVEEEEAPAPTPAPKPTVVAALKRASASAPKPKTTTVTEIQKRAFARQYMVEHGAKVEDLRNPEKINETIASEEFTAWMNAR